MEVQVSLHMANTTHLLVYTDSRYLSSLGVVLIGMSHLMNHMMNHMMIHLMSNMSDSSITATMFYLVFSIGAYGYLWLPIVQMVYIKHQ